ncbi:MAG: outer membrane protein transport protein [Candidatus Latescibacteria bacterium]|nr:outer membrane protein transport protein [Candidatus Latescibacterota bacterium]
MTRTRAAILFAGAATLLLAGPAAAGGFNIYEAGARATALGGAFTATADDGSAIFYNPAGLAFLDGMALDLNLMPVIPSSEFTGALRPDGSYATGKTVDQSFPIPGAYWYRNTGDLTFGIGLSAPFGLGVEWADPEAWVGRRASYDVDLATVYVTPALSWKVEETVGIAFGLDIAHADIQLNKRSATLFGANPENDPNVDVLDASIEGTSRINVTPMMGLMIKASPKVTFGVMYHHQKKMEVRNGKLTLTNVAPAALTATVDAQIAALGGAEHDGVADLKLPHILAVGVAYQATEKARVEFDAVHFGWGYFDELVLDFEGVALDQTIREDYEDVLQLRFGAQYQVTPKLLAMAGYVRDESPQPVGSMSPLLPDASRNDYSFGLQLRATERVTLTGTYMGVNFEERSNVENGVQQSFETEFNPAGSYDSYAHIFGVGIGYRF